MKTWMGGGDKPKAILTEKFEFGIDDRGATYCRGLIRVTGAFVAMATLLEIVHTRGTKKEREGLGPLRRELMKALEKRGIRVTTRQALVEERRISGGPR